MTTELFPHLRRNTLGTLTWIGLKMTDEFIRHQTTTLECGREIKPQIPNFCGKQSAVTWAISRGLLPRETKDANISVIEGKKR